MLLCNIQLTKLTMIYKYNYFNHKLKNFIQLIVLFLFMGVVLSILGYVLAGINGIFWAGFLGALILAISPNISPTFILSLYGGKLLSSSEVPVLYQMIQELAVLAKLPTYPVIFYLPSQTLNAFSVGNPENAAIGMSDGLLHSLTLREIKCVMAHEISHIQHNDVRLINYANLFSHIASTLSFTGFFLILLNLPLYFMGMVTISWLALGILILAPNLMTFLQLLISRMREYDADLQASLLTEDPEGLAMALVKLERYESSNFDNPFYVNYRPSIPSCIKTHPETKERIQRLLKLKKTVNQSLNLPNDLSFNMPLHYKKMLKKPSWHLNGLWY